MGPCDLFDGPLDPGGYGMTKMNGKLIRAHRKAWITHHGEIPPGFMVLHRCDVRNCQAIDHLFLGTHSENMVDMARKKRARWSGVTHCIRGHKYTEENTRKVLAGRICKECQKIRDKNRNRKKEPAYIARMKHG